MTTTQQVSLDQALQMAVEQHRLGNLDAAAQIYDAILGAVPDHLDAMGLRGTIHAQQGQYPQAEALLRRAVALNDEFTDAWLNLGHAYMAQGKAQEAIPCFEMVTRQRPTLADAWQLLGAAALQCGQPDRAETALRSALGLDAKHGVAHFQLGQIYRARGNSRIAELSFEQALQALPNMAEAWFMAGVLAQERGDLTTATARYRQAATLRPDYVEAWCNLGNVQREQKDLAAAEQSYRKALLIQPGFADALNNLGNVLREQNRIPEAIHAYRQSLALQPQFKQAWENLGLAQHDGGLYAEAEASIQRALELDPAMASAHYSLGNVLLDQHRLVAAGQHYDQALALQPHYPEVYNNRANALSDRGDQASALAGYRTAMEQDPKYVEPWHNLLLTLHYDASQTPDTLFAEHRAIGARIDAPAPAPAPHGNGRDPERKLRIGYVSPDFRDHSVAYFIEGVLEAHSRDQFELYAYASHTVADGVTARLRALVPNWRSIAGQDDATAAATIRADGIDLLIDLAGHTAHSRLPTFAHKPAPLQLTWIGYPNTTGVAAIDYRITDWATDPAGAEALHTERLLRLPRVFSCYRPPSFAPEVQAPPHQAAGQITFGSFNNRAKLNDAVFDAWAAILQRVPNSRLLLKSAALIEDETQEALRHAFAQRDIAPSRLLLLAKDADPVAHLARYQQVDIALDPFPYNGTTTTCEALWMGVPVIALRGDHHVARVAAAQLAACGLSSLIADNPAAYVDLACALAADTAQLASLRQSLRPQLQASPLLDTVGVTREFETLLREIWREYCA